MATIQDVAQKAGVGVATVSRVLSGKGYVKEETKNKVLSAIKELDYTPNEIARHLYYNKTGIVAVIVPQIAHPFYSEFVDKVVVELFANNYKTMICNTWSEGRYELQYFDMLRRNMVDGIICGTHSITTEEYANIDRPIVALDHTFGENVPCVCVDHHEGGSLAAKELIDAGCRNIVQFRGTPGIKSPSEERHVVFEEIVRANNIEYHDIITERNDVSYRYADVLAEKLFNEYPDVDGVFGTDIVIMAVIKRARALSINIPKNLKVVAYDGTGITDLACPGLTKICQPIDELAIKSVEIMMSLIAGNKPKNNVVNLRVKLKRDESTSCK